MRWHTQAIDLSSGLSMKTLMFNGQSGAAWPSWGKHCRCSVYLSSSQEWVLWFEKWWGHKMGVNGFNLNHIPKLTHCWNNSICRWKLAGFWCMFALLSWWFADHVMVRPVRTSLNHLTTRNNHVAFNHLMTNKTSLNKLITSTNQIKRSHDQQKPV